MYKISRCVFMAPGFSFGSDDEYRFVSGDDYYMPFSLLYSISGNRPMKINPKNLFDKDYAEVKRKFNERIMEKIDVKDIL